MKTNNGVQLRSVNLTQLLKTIKSTVKWTGSVAIIGLKQLLVLDL